MSSADRKVIVSDIMQEHYEYVCTAGPGADFADDFTPQLTPKEMLALGVFGGVYMRDCRDEFPADWFTEAKFSPGARDAKLNFFEVNASQPGDWSCRRRQRQAVLHWAYDSRVL